MHSVRALVNAGKIRTDCSFTLTRWDKKMAVRRKKPIMVTLTIDIGGTGIKMLRIDDRGRPLSNRYRVPTPKAPTPEVIMPAIARMTEAQKPFHRVSVGFPGVVKHGVVKTAPNLGTDDWVDFDIREAIASSTKKPVRVINDAELQGFGVIEGKGVEIVLTLGTGLGSALYVNGHLTPNLELAHHPFRNGKTYEQLVGEKALKRIGKGKWRKRIKLVIETLEPIFNYDVLYLGGGNAKKLK